MLYVKILPPILQNDEVHTRTIVQVSDNPDFTNLLIDDDRPDELLSRIYNISLVTNKDYYIRVRFYLEPGGMQALSDTKVFQVTDRKDTELLITPPIYAEMPTIVPAIAGSDTDYPIMFLKFGLILSPNLENRLRKVEWFLFNIHGGLEYTSSDNSGKINYLIIKKMLEMNKVYILKVTITTITNTTSDLASFVFRTHPSNILVIEESIQYQEDVPVIFDLNPVNSYTIEIYDIDNKLIYSDVSSVLNVDITTLGIDITRVIFIRLQETGATFWNYIYRQSTSNTTRLPFNLPTYL